MNCEKFMNLSPKEKIIFIGKLNHACMSMDYLFDKANELIDIAEAMGLFDRAKIMPSAAETETFINQ
jgi:hypothetical protein